MATRRNLPPKKGTTNASCSKGARRGKKTSAQRRKELERKITDAQRELRDIERRERTAIQESPVVRKNAERVVELFRVYLSNVSDELQRHGAHPRYRVALNQDRTVDAEIRVPYPTKVRTVDQATDLLNIIEETIGVIPEVQYLSVGFTLAQRANEEGVRKSVKQYVRYEGELRLSPNYYRREFTALSFQAAYEILRNIYNAHGELPTGMLIRFAWAPDGRLHRKNDEELRKAVKPAKSKSKKGAKSR